MAKGPGSIKLLGEHTEYTGGLVLSAAIDRYVTTAGKRKHGIIKKTALLTNCRTRQVEHVPFELRSVKLVIALAGLKYDPAPDARVRECKEALGQISWMRGGIECLGQLLKEDLATAQQVLPENQARRVEHIVRENERVRQGVARLKAGDLEAFGALMFQSHDSMSKLYEVSSKRLDALVDAARGECLGAKAAEGGVVAIVEDSRLAALRKKLKGVELIVCGSST